MARAGESHKTGAHGSIQCGIQRNACVKFSVCFDVRKKDVSGLHGSEFDGCKNVGFFRKRDDAT